jgi:hypothetical protein
MVKTVRLWFTVTHDVTYATELDASEYEVTEDLKAHCALLVAEGKHVQDMGAYSVKRVHGVFITDPDGISVDSY